MKKIAMIGITAVLALSVMGFGFAKWSSSASATVNPNTGSLKLGWVDNPFFSRDSGPDWHATQGFGNIALDSESKDVGSTTGSFQDTNGDGVLDRYNVTIDNAYPYYYNEISGNITNLGTIPMIIQKPVLSWMDTQQTIEDGTVYWLGADGHIIQPTPEQLATPLKVGENWVLELRWDDNAGKQIHPGITLEESFEVQVLQPAAQNHQYHFGISVEGIQWNEIK